MPEAIDTLQFNIKEAMKVAMKAGEKQRLGVIRLMMAGIKQREVDERITLDDAAVVGVLDKMVKQRRESSKLYRAAARNDLADIEEFEIQQIQEFLPMALSDGEIDTIIRATIEEIGADSIGQMGAVMAHLKPKMQGRADMGKVSGCVKNLLVNG